MNFNVTVVDPDLNTVTTRCRSSGPWDRGWMGHAGGPHPKGRKDRKARKGRVSFAAISADQGHRMDLATSARRRATGGVSIRNVAARNPTIASMASALAGPAPAKCRSAAHAAILDRNRSNLARTETRECTASRCPRRNRVPMDSAFNVGKARDRKVQDPKARAHGVQGNTLRLTRLPCRAGLSAI